jgi:hypothetical protein
MYDLDDETARRLLRPLDEDPTIPSTVDISALLVAGRRRKRARRWLASGGITGFVVVTLVAVPVSVAALGGAEPSETQVAEPPARHVDRPAAPPPVPTSCTAQRLQIPAGATESLVVDGDPTGRYLVGVARNDVTGRAWTIRWDRGRMDIIDAPVTEALNLAVNSHGVVVGDGMAGGATAGEHVAFVYRNGRFTTLRGLAGSANDVVTVADVNERGDVLGADITEQQGEQLEGAYVPKQRLVVWQASGAIRELARPAGEGWANATTIDDDGTVVGYRLGPDVGRAVSFGPSSSPIPELPRRDTSPATDTRGLVWSVDGSVRELAAPAGYGPGTAATVLRAGLVLGWYQDPTKHWPEQVDTVPATWNLATGAVQPVRSGLSHVGGVNRHGWFVGSVRLGGAPSRPAVAYGDRVLELPAYPEVVPGLEGTSATTISDDGREIGGAFSVGPAAAITATRWTCR